MADAYLLGGLSVGWIPRNFKNFDFQAWVVIFELSLIIKVHGGVHFGGQETLFDGVHSHVMDSLSQCDFGPY